MQSGRRIERKSLLGGRSYSCLASIPRDVSTTSDDDDDDDDLVVILVFEFDARRVARPSTHRRSKNRPRTGRWTAAWIEDVAGTEGKLGKVASHVATVRRVSTRGCPDTRREFEDGQFLFFSFSFLFYSSSQ